MDRRGYVYSILMNFFLVYPLFLARTSGYNVLIVSSQLQSHMMYFTAVGNGLVKRGHNVFVAVHRYHPLIDNIRALGITPMEFEMPVDSCTATSKIFEDIVYEDLFVRNLKNVDMEIQSKCVLDDCEYFMRDQQFLQRAVDLKFDIAIADGVRLNRCSYILPAYLNIRYVTLSSGFDSWLMRVPSLPSFVPVSSVFSSDRMNFWQRMDNLYRHIRYPFPAYQSTRNYSLIERYLGVTNLTWDGLAKKSLLFFSTRDYILEWPRPLMPNVIQIACVTCHQPKPLPNTIQEFMDNSKHGVLYVSFGSVSRLLPQIINLKLLTTFRKLNLSVIWKFSGDLASLGDITPNILLKSWLPQNDILGHPKTKLFITHCGNNGQYESLYNAVPMIGFPLHSEQGYNAFRMQDHKYGVTMDIYSFTPEDLVEQVQRVMASDSVRESVDKASRLLRARPQEARDVAAYWIEHVLKFGADHLRSHAMAMPWYQYLMLDICAFLLFIIIVAAVMTIQISLSILKYLRLLV